MDLGQWWPKLLNILILVIVALVLRFLLRRLIDRVITASERASDQRSTEMGDRAAAVLQASGALDNGRVYQRTATVGQALKSVLDGVLIVIVVLTALDSAGVSLGPVLASAGIGGLAIGFGAQSLIKDVISGAFLVFEDQFGVGDRINVGVLEGTVQHVGFRTTRIQDGNGEIWYIRNGEIVTLGNQTQGWSTSIIGIPAALHEDPARVIEILTGLVSELDAEPEWHNRLLESPVVLGLGALDANQQVFQISIKTPANKQWAVEREIRARALQAFQKNAIQTAGQVAPVPPTEPAAAP